MRKIFTSILLLTLCTTLIFAQDRVREKNLKGDWKMIIDVDMDEVSEEMEEESWFGYMISGALTGLVENVLDEIDIKMKFMDGGKLKITVIAFGEEEIEYGEWYINGEGQLVIIDEDNEHDDTDVWMMNGDNLVSYQLRSGGRLERQEVYLKRL
jgi:hypothetical protein